MGRGAKLSALGARRILECVEAAADGITAAAVCEAVHLSSDYVSWLLHKLKVAGSVSYVGGGSRGVWCIPSRADVIWAARRLERARKRAEYERGYKMRLAAVRSAQRAKSRAAMDAKESQPDDEMDDAPVVHRIIKADACEPMKPRGPVSVWEYAARG